LFAERNCEIWPVGKDSDDRLTLFFLYAIAAERCAGRSTRALSTDRMSIYRQLAMRFSGTECGL